MAAKQAQDNASAEDNAGSRTRQNLAAATQADAVDEAIDALMDDGWKPLLAPMIGGLRQKLLEAETPDEARAILAEAFADLDAAALTDKLAKAMFAARLAGETGEGL